MNPLRFTMLNDRDFQTCSVALHFSPTSDYFVLKFQKEVAFHMKKKCVCVCFPYSHYRLVPGAVMDGLICIPSWKEQTLIIIILLFHRCLTDIFSSYHKLYYYCIWDFLLTVNNAIFKTRLLATIIQVQCCTGITMDTFPT